MQRTIQPVFQQFWNLNGALLQHFCILLTYHEAICNRNICYDSNSRQKITTKDVKKMRLTIMGKLAEKSFPSLREATTSIVTGKAWNS
ncbi:unnamed protein product [Caenorhabditis brenneri]